MELEEAAALMVQHRIRRLPVVESGELVGIVTLDDIAVRTGDLEVAQRMTQEVIEGALPELLLPRARLSATPVSPATPDQLRTRARVESLIGLAAPALDLVLAAGERISRVVGREDDYIPIRPASDRLELGRGERIAGPESD